MQAAVVVQLANLSSGGRRERTVRSTSHHIATGMHRLLVSVVVVVVLEDYFAILLLAHGTHYFIASARRDGREET